MESAVLVIGPPGVGKTSVLTALHDLLVDDGIASAVVEVEALAWSHPPLADDQAFRHVNDVCRGYARAGRPLLLCGATATSQRYLDRLLDALAAAECFVVRLKADPTTLQARIVEREPPGWSGLDQLLTASTRLAASSESLERIDLVLSTDGVAAPEVAERIRAECPYLLKHEV